MKKDWESKLIIIIMFIVAFWNLILKNGYNESLSNIAITFFIYIVYVMIRYSNAKEDKIRELTYYPIVYMLGLMTTVFIICEIIPNIKETPFIIKVFFLIVSIIILVAVYKYIIRIKEIKKIEIESRKHKNRYEYYREILSGYSAAVLGITYNKKVKYSDLLISTLLNLSLKSFIKIESDGIYILKREFENLETNEQFVLEKISKSIIEKNEKCINYKKINNIFMNKSFKGTWNNKIREDAKFKNIYNIQIISFEKVKILFEKLFKIMLAFIICMYLVIFGIGITKNIIFYAVFFMILVLMLILCSELIKKKEVYFYTRTKKGVDLQNKLFGLKRYIKNFSNIRNTSLSEIALWEEYSIYAIIFDFKGNLDKEADILYKKILEL